MVFATPHLESGVRSQSVTRKGWIITMAIFVALAAIVLAGRFAGEGAGVEPTYKSVIDRMEADRDCVALQDSFDGTNDTDKMQYIDDALRDAGCYGG